MNRVATFRGKVKERVRSVIEHMFDLRYPPLSEEDVQHNRELVKKLNPNTFHCRVCMSLLHGASMLTTDRPQVFDPRSGHYEHPAIWRALAAAIFHNRDAIGVLHREYFNPLPIPTMAFVLTTVCHLFHTQHKRIQVDAYIYRCNAA